MLSLTALPKSVFKIQIISKKKMKNNLVKQNCGWKKTDVNDGLVTLPLGLKI